jgi:CTP-dependent riboflavin kinase
LCECSRAAVNGLIPILALAVSCVAQPAQIEYVKIPVGQFNVVNLEDGRMRTLRGTVSGGYGVATENLAPFMTRIVERTGLPSLVAGTLNVRIDEPYIMCADAKLTAAEYYGYEEIKLQRSRIQGVRTVIMRPTTHEAGAAHGPAHLELLSHLHLRTALHLKDGDPVEVEVEGDDNWWVDD